ncbi:flagellin [Shimia sp. R9_2]|uniref:flagellin n=1 Tax=Shimia sp. R9_2 TaxID=2821112 RepID=UPI001ADA384A|nr:flagellin [Shimia sp. R9_2]MBO9395406.1 flagellin [Shimia sp. R9_2]
MTSLLTNNGAMVALQTLKSVNASLSETQGQISTGKKVDNAKQNAAVWAISKTMESDVNGFKSVQESLALGESTVAVARQATETVTELLGEIKTRIASATGDNVDRAKLTNEITSLREQISSVVGAAQFNGLNLVDGSATSTEVLSSLDRANGNVSASSITVDGVDLDSGGYTAQNVFGINTDGITAANDGFATNVADGATADIEVDGTLAGLTAGDTLTLNLGGQEVSYQISAEDIAATSTTEAIAVGLKNAIEDQTTFDASELSVDYDASGVGTGDTIEITNNTGESMNISGQYQNAGAGDLAALSTLDISNSSAAQASLASIESLINTTIDASAAFGTVESRISIQKDFISNLSDSVKSGIGSLVDADMEETSARLQALQVQQQLATQSLSIANQGPQQLLSLFR